MLECIFFMLARSLRRSREYTVQASSNLTTWDDIAESVGGAATTIKNNSGCEVFDAGTGLRTVRVTEKDAITGKRFLRVKVTSP